MSITFNLNKFYNHIKLSSVSPIGSSEVLDILSKDQKNLNKEDVYKLFNYFENSFLNKTSNLPEVIDINNKIVKFISELSTSKNSSNDIKIVAISVFKKIQNKYNELSSVAQDDQEPVSPSVSPSVSTTRFSSEISSQIYDVLKKINDVSKKIVEEIKPNLNHYKKNIVLPKGESASYGWFLQKYINEINEGSGKKSEATIFAEGKIANEPIFLLEDFFTLYFPKFLHIYLNADVSILKQKKMHEDLDVSNQIIENISSYYNTGTALTREIYSSKENFGIPFHASSIYYGNQKVSYTSLELMKHFLTMLIDKDWYAISFVLDQYFENMYRRRDLEITLGTISPDKNSKIISQEFRRSEVKNSELIGGMMHFAVTDNFFKTLSSSIDSCLNSGGYRSWLCIEQNAPLNSDIKSLASVVVTEINESLNKIKNSYESIKYYNNQVLKDVYPGMNGLNFMLQIMLARRFYMREAKVESQDIGSKDEVEITNLNKFTKVIIILKKIDCKPVRARYKSHKWGDESEITFNKEVVVDRVILKVLNNAVIKSEFTQSSNKSNINTEPDYIDLYNQNIYYYKSKGDSLKEEDFSLKHVRENFDSTGRAIITVNGDVLNNLRQSMEQEDWDDIKDQISSYFALNPDQFAYIILMLSRDVSLKETLSKAYAKGSSYISETKSYSRESDYVARNSVHIEKLKNLIDEIVKFYSLSFKIQAGSYGLSNESFECYSSLGKFILEKNIKDMESSLSKLPKDSDEYNKINEKIKEIKSFMDSVQYVFYYGGPKTPNNRIIDNVRASTDWKYSFPAFPDWIINAITIGRQSHDKYSTSGGQAGLTEVSENIYANAKIFENLKNLINNYLQENFDTYELLDLLGIRRKYVMKNFRQSGYKNVAPEMAAQVLANEYSVGTLQDKCGISKEDLVDFRNMHGSYRKATITDDGEKCYGDACASIDQVFRKNKIAFFDSHNNLIKKSFNYIKYDINDWLRIMARKVYIG